MGIKVKLVQLGRGVLNSELDAGATVQDALSSQRIPIDGMEVRVNSEQTTLDHPLRNGDLVTVVPLIRGGSAQPSTASDRSTAFVTRAWGAVPNR